MKDRPSRGLRLMLLVSTVTVIAVQFLVFYTFPRLQYISELEKALLDRSETSPKSRGRASMKSSAVKATKKQVQEEIVLNSSVNNKSPKRDKGTHLAKGILSLPPDNRSSNAVARFAEPSKTTRITGSRKQNTRSTVRTKYPASVRKSSLTHVRLTNTNNNSESIYQQQHQLVLKSESNNKRNITGQDLQTVRPSTPPIKQKKSTKSNIEMGLQNSIPQRNGQTVRPAKPVEQTNTAPQIMKMNISGSQTPIPHKNGETFKTLSQTAKTGRLQPPVALSGSATQQTKPRVMYLIYLCDKHRSCGGWGDRQRGLLNAYLLSVITGRRFGINMTHPCDIKIFFVPNKVNWYIKLKELKGLSWEVVDWMDNPRLVDKDTKIDFNRKYTSDIVFLKTNQGMVHRVVRSPFYAGKIPKDFHMNYDKLLKKYWYLLMKLSIHMEEHLDLFIRKVHKSGNLLCAHVRIRRNPTIPNDGAPINSLSSLSSLWNFLSLSVHKPVSRIFIATDSEEVRMEARKRFGSKELDTDGLIRHVDRQGAWSNACLGFEMVILDQLILSRCDILIRSTSHFSHKASILSLKHHKVFIFQNGTIKESVT